MRKLKLGLASLAAVAVLAGCSSATAFTDVSGQVATRSTATGNSGSSEALNTLLPENQESHYSQEDSDYDESSVTQITLNGSSATASGGGVTVDGSPSRSHPLEPTAWPAPWRGRWSSTPTPRT